MTQKCGWCFSPDAPTPTPIRISSLHFLTEFLNLI